MIDARCTGCHVEDSIGGFDLSTYESVYAARLLTEVSLRERTMPPWLAGDDCADYQHSFQLEPAERELLLSWLDQGAPGGDPANEGAPLEAPSSGLSRVDVELEMPDAYEPQLKPDDYRCFPIDWEGEETQYLTGFNVIPGNPEIVHHVIAFYAGPDLAEEVEQKEAGEEGHGYTCFGTPGVGESIGFGADAVGWLGTWAPGGQGIDFPEGTGIPVEPGSKVILQVHYNTYEGETETDQSSVQFSVEDEVEHQAMYLPWANFTWPGDPNSMLIPAGDPEATHSFGFDIVGAVGQRVKIHSSMLHMHLLGTSAKLWIDRADTDDECLLDIPRWDFNWQHEYVLEEPRVLEAGDELWIECQWDNTEANQPVIQGERQEPRDVGWGDGTTDEMCLGVLYATFE